MVCFEMWWTLSDHDPEVRDRAMEDAHVHILFSSGHIPDAVCLLPS